MSHDSKWTHSLCEPCWNRREGARPPVRVKGMPPEQCCVCGTPSVADIPVRADPDAMPACLWTPT
jgi:hypothetical protein